MGKVQAPRSNAHGLLRPHGSAEQLRWRPGSRDALGPGGISNSKGECVCRSWRPTSHPRVSPSTSSCPPQCTSGQHPPATRLREDQHGEQGILRVKRKPHVFTRQMVTSGPKRDVTCSSSTGGGHSLGHSLSAHPNPHRTVSGSWNPGRVEEACAGSAAGLTAMLTFPRISSGILLASFSTWSREPPS